MKTYLKDLKPEEIIKRLKDGEVVHSDGFWIYKMIDGVICAFFKKQSYIGAMIDVDRESEFYFETEEPFEIKETGFYKTRASAKVYVNSIDENRKKVIGGVIGWEDKYFYWNKNGVYCSGREDAKDIIGKWKD